MQIIVSEFTHEMSAVDANRFKILASHVKKENVIMLYFSSIGGDAGLLPYVLDFARKVKEEGACIISVGNTIISAAFVGFMLGTMRYLIGPPQKMDVQIHYPSIQENDDFFKQFWELTFPQTPYRSIPELKNLVYQGVLLEKVGIIQNRYSHVTDWKDLSVIKKLLDDYGKPPLKIV